MLGVRANIYWGGVYFEDALQTTQISAIPTLPALHGGAISGLMEIAAIAQLYITTNGKSLSKPIGINVDYLRKGLPKDTYARAVVFKQGARVANVRVRSWQEDYTASQSQ